MKRLQPACLILALVIAVVAQQPASGQEPDVVRITTNLVQVDVVVTKDGKQVKDLSADDFEIFEDGRRKAITHFSYIPALNASDRANLKTPPLPPGVSLPLAPVKPEDVKRTIAFVVDDLGMSIESMIRVRSQLHRLINEQVGPDDLVAIIRTGGGIGALQQFTTDKRILESAIDALKWNPCSRVGREVLPPSRSYPGSNVSLCSLYVERKTTDSLRFIVKGMSALHGRKSLVIFSDSLPSEQQQLPTTLSDRGSLAEGVIGNSDSMVDQLNKIGELAIRGSVVIYAVDTSGLPTTGINPGDEIREASGSQTNPNQEPTLRLLRERSTTLRLRREGATILAKQTGGVLLRNTNDFQGIMEDLQGYYLIGYKPDADTFNRRFHRLKARVKRNGFEVRTRTGFYGITEDEAREKLTTPLDQINGALISPFSANDIKVQLTTSFINERADDLSLRSLLFFDAGNLRFKDEADGSHVANLEVAGVVFGDNGTIVGRKDQDAVLRLRGEPYERVRREGVVYTFDTPVSKSGPVQFRVVVRDAGSGRIGSSYQFMNVPNLQANLLTLSGLVVHDEKTLQTGPVEVRSETGTDAYTREPAMRKFHQGTTLVVSYLVYDAKVAKTTNLPELRFQSRIFRDGQSIYSSDETPIDLAGQTDLARVKATSKVKLGPKLGPGEYMLQISVEDRLATGGQRTATQWIDFEILP
ncbi:MAG TPA: VWA domain-containing protein [Pyrinomonadaceae bacterium]|nr:VWA domain-containing protein [Pyrinomonadaceae bacterium]